jgi:hypothetical protein
MKHPSSGGVSTAYVDLSPIAKIVLLLESLPDPDESEPVAADAPATKRTALRDRLGSIITLDRAGTDRSIVNQPPATSY